MIKKNNKKKIWRKALLKMLIESDWHNNKEIFFNLDLINGFCFQGIKLIKRKKRTKKNKMPILISVVRDEMERMPMFMEHYRKMGIEHFVIIDNNSKDGTLEYLTKQSDVDVFSVKRQWKSGRKLGWINKIMYLYGFCRWYLIVDADELMEWPERGAYPLQRVIKILESKNVKRAGALMVDLYTKGNLFEGEIGKDIDNELYFDCDTYTSMREGDKVIYIGGPRKRVYGVSCYLSKYPLIYLEEGELLICAHYMYPYNRFKDYPFIFALLHYKFLTVTDFDKVKRYVKEGNYVSNSYEYRCYLQQYKKGNKSFYYRYSEKYKSPESLNKIKLIKAISGL